MQIPPILKGESPKRMLQAAAVGAIATIVIGFTWGGSLGSILGKPQPHSVFAPGN